MSKKEICITNITKVIAIFVLSYTVTKILVMIGNITCTSVLYNCYNEVRDYVCFRLTNFILEGKNPYTLEILQNSNVPFMCLYTILNPLLVAVVCKITGLSVMAGNYFVNILLVIMTTYNIWQIVKNFFSGYKTIYLICVGINVSTFFALFGLPIFNFHADTISIFMMSCIMLIVYKNKELTLPLAILSVLLIFTKQILIVMACPLFIYYLVTNRKLAWKYLCECIVCGVVTIVTIQIMFPLYWTETIYVQFFTSKNYGSIYSSIENLAIFFYRYVPWLIFIFVGTVVTIIIRSRYGYKFSLVKFVGELIEHEEYAVYLILNILLGIVFLLYFAKCGDDGRKYCQDILASSWLVLSLYVWAYYFERFWIENNHHVQLKKSLILISVCIASVITFFNFNYNQYTKNDIAAYTEMNEIISAHADQRMFLGMNATWYLLNENLWETENIYFDDGHLEYFNVDYPENVLLNSIFYDEEIESATNDYVERVNDLMKSKEFGIIAICGCAILDADALQENYYIYATYSIKTDVNGYFDVDIWLPK